MSFSELPQETGHELIVPPGSLELSYFDPLEPSNRAKLRAIRHRSPMFSGP